MVRSTHRRTPLLLGGTGLAMAAVLALPSPADAQAFNGSPVFVRGGGNVDRSVPNVDTITITSPTAVLDWTPFEDNFGNALTFLPNGSTAYFQNAPGQGGFAVLNRILPSTNGNVVVFDGAVISRLLAADGTASSGGTVAFYSPTGILVGGNAVFDVGQLLLTTLDPDLDSFDSYAAGGTLQLTGAPGSTAAVEIGAGAQISASGEGSYFAVAAPQIVMRGNAYINGTSAYVAGEQVNLTYNNGLFDIQIPVGTSVGTPIDHSGTTGGPSSTGSGDNHLIYAVARAAADPITMLLRGNLGFDAATTAGIDNGDIILSAGYDVFGRTVATGMVDAASLEESISILGGTNLTSRVFAGATGSFSADTAGGAIDFAENLTVRAARSIALTARNGNDLTVAGDSIFESKGTTAASGDVVGGSISLTARGGATMAFTGAVSAFATPDQRNGTATGGTVALIANGGTLTVGGEVRLFAQANNFFPTGSLGDGFGGTTSLLAQNNGVIDLGGALVMNTNAFGNGFAGRAATGGTSEIVALSGGQIDVAGAISLQASGFGGAADGTLGVIDGGAGLGGSIQLLANGGSIAFGSTLSMIADGVGGAGASNYQGGPGDVGGLGRGGQLLINAIDGSITIADDVSLVARGFGGAGGSGGAGIGGLAQVFADGTGTIALTDVSSSAHGFGGDGSADDGRGGDAEGGQSIILTLGTGDIRLTGGAAMQAIGVGGDGHTGGNAVGGNAGIYAVFGNIAIDGDAFLIARASGGDANVGFGGNGGNAIGGTAYVQADGSQSASATLTIGGTASIDASGFGGVGGAGDGGSIAAGNGGNGTGGTYQGQPGTGGAFAIAGRDNATLQISGETLVFARGFGGAGGLGGSGQAGGAGGVGTGGTAQAGTFSGRGDGSAGAGRATFNALTLNSSGAGGGGGTGGSGLGAGGLGRGGTAGLFAVGSRVEAGAVIAIADGTGGTGAVGGEGVGGDAGVGVFAGILTATSLSAAADGNGGDATTGDGGDGIGGEASIDSDGELNVSGDIDYVARGAGGSSESGNGGFGQGGIARITATGSGALTVAGLAELDASASGGTGAADGGADGGTALVELAGAASAEFEELELTADGLSGAGAATGGLARVLTSGEARLSAQYLQLDANSSDIAGSFEILADGGTISLAQILASAVGAEAGETSLIRASGGTMPITGAAGFTVTGDLDIVTANGGFIGGPSLTAPTATIAILSDGTVTFDGDDDNRIGFGGQSLLIRSRELDILSGARIGAETLGLIVVGNDATTVLGGEGDTEGYTLTQAEAGRIEAGSAAFLASNDGMASDNILIRDMTVVGSLDDGLSSLIIQAGGFVRVEGRLAYVNAAETDQLAILSDRLEIVTPGGIAMLGPQDNPTGLFSFFGRDFWMADSETIARLREDVAFAGRNGVLATAAAGSDDPLGYLRAGNVALVVGSSLLIRNSGTDTAPGGITVTGGLTISSAYSDPFGSDSALPTNDPLDVLAFGRRLNADGSFTTGEAFFRLVDFTVTENGEGFASTYTDGSQFNNCGINTRECAGVEPPEPPSPPQPPDERDEVLDQLDEQAPAAAVTTTEPIAAAPVEQSEQDSNVEFGADFPGLLNASLSTQEDTIDDPVASGGDVALYGAGEDEDAGEDEGDDAGEGSDAD